MIKIPSYPNLPPHPEKCPDFDFVYMNYWAADRQVDLANLIRQYLLGECSNKERRVLASAFNSIIAHCVVTGDLLCARSWAVYKSQIMSEDHISPLPLIHQEECYPEPYKEEF